MELLGTLRGSGDGLGRVTVRQTSYSLASQAIQAVLQVGSVLILARFLAPEDFGLIAMVATVVAFIGIFKDIGLTQAIVQQRNLTPAQASGLFWVSALSTVALAACTLIAAPLVAAFFREPALAPITAVYAGAILVTGLGSVPQAILARQMAFHVIVVVELAAATLGVVFAIAVAVLGGGYWALVALSVVGAVTSTVLLWRASRWRPSRPVRHSGIRSLLGFGGRVTGSNVAAYIGRNADDLLIGRVWGPGLLGQYAAAYRVLLLPLAQVSEPLARVVVPALVRVAEDPDRYRLMFMRIVRALMSITSPAMAFALVSADWLIRVLLGPGWDTAATVLAWLSLIGIVQPLTNATGWLFLTQGRSSELLRWSVLSATLSVASFLLGLPLGPEGVAAAYSVSGVLIRAPLLIFWVGRRGPVSTRDLVRVSIEPLLLSTWVVLSTLTVRVIWPDVAPLAGIGFSLALILVGGAAIVTMTPAGRHLRQDAATVLGEFRPRRASNENGRSR